MAVPKETRWAIQLHTQVKHQILKRYLDAWLPIMTRYNGRVVFIDGFAGPGRYEGGEEGSPIIALRTLLEHSHFQANQPRGDVVFLFIEARADRAAALKKELADLAALKPFPKWLKHDVLEGEFAPLMKDMLDSLDTGGSQLAPTFAFIDPFGFTGAPMEVIARIVKHASCECFINFSYESINRFLEHPEPGIQQRFDELFGSADWRTLGAGDDAETRRSRIIGLYRTSLVQKAKLKYVRTFEMINESNRTEYLLYFGTNSRDGLSKMKQAMWRADPDTGQVFSDRSNPDQLVLLEVGAEQGLRPLLRTRFRGQGFIPIATIETYVLEDTPYSEAMHLKKKTLAVMEKSTPSEIEVQRPKGSPNRAGSYPPGTQIKFL